MPSARELCPKTVELVGSVPSINAALFALVPAHSKLGKHRDPFAGSLRYHLDLITPNFPHCRIWIDGNEYSWRDGEAVLFDETYIHSARNDTEEDRIILFCDVARPIKNPVFRAINRFITRRIAKSTASQNVSTERIGPVNHVAASVYRIKTFAEAMKKWNRRLYYLGKYAMMIALAWLVPF